MSAQGGAIGMTAISGFLQMSWWAVTTPELVIMLTVLGLNVFAEGLRGLYDPRSRG